MAKAAESQQVAVIGAGLGGLAAATAIQRAGRRVRVFDKGRGVGGRLATRRADGGRRFDHGAQYFTARDSAFITEVESWVAAGVAARWEGRIRQLAGGTASDLPDDVAERERYVGVPGMSAIAKHLAAEVPPQGLHFGVRIAAVERQGARWLLRDDSGGEVAVCDAVLLNVPAPQAEPLLAAVPSLAERLGTVEFRPCWAVMTEWPAELPIEADAAFVEGSPLGWVSRDSSKPGRQPGERWVLHAGPEWSREHLERNAEDVLPGLLDAFRDAAGLPAGIEPTYAVAHRWRYSLVERGLGEACLWDARQRIGACGDWCLGGRVEGAYLSGAALAANLLAD